MTVYVLYQTDTWHSHESRELRGIFTTYKKMLDAIETIARGDDATISEDDKYLLENIQQTQNYEGDGEFLYEILEANQIV